MVRRYSNVKDFYPILFPPKLTSALPGGDIQKKLECLMLRLIRRFCTDRTAATAIEYAVIGALLSIVIVSGVTAIGTELREKYIGSIANALT